MGKVLKADASAGDAAVEVDFAGVPDAWETFRLAFSAASRDAEPHFATLYDPGDFTVIEDVAIGDDGTAPVWFTLEDQSETPPLTEDSWHAIEIHHVNGGASDLYVDGILAVTGADSFNKDTGGLVLGISGVGATAGLALYFGDVKVGTTRGGSDIFADNFSSGDFSAWTSTSGDVSVVDDPFPPAPPPHTGAIRLYDPPLWRGILAAYPSGRTLTSLDSRAAERSFVFARNKPTTATGLVATDDPEINLPFPDLDSPARLSHNTRLIYWLRRESGATPPYVPRASGLVMQIEDVAADTPTARYTTFDSWQLLMARPVRDPASGAPTGATYTNQRGSAIALDLLVNSVLLDGDALIDFTDLARIHDTPIITGKVVFEPGLSVGEAWTRLTDTGTIDIYLKPIYDPVGRPGKLVELFIFPELGTIRYDAVFGWGMGPRNIASLSRMVDGTRLANEVQFYAGSAPVPLQTDAASVAEFGEYWSQQFDVAGAAQADLVELAALAELELRKDGTRSLTFNPAPERSPLALAAYGVGDYLPVYLPRDLREPLAPNLDYPPLDFQRAEQITINLDDNGVEQVEIQTAGDAA